MNIPGIQSCQSGHIFNVVIKDPDGPGMHAGSSGQRHRPGVPGQNHPVAPFLILADNGTGPGQTPESDTHRAHQSPLAAQKNGGLIQHHALMHIAHHRRGGFVLVGGVIEMNKRRPDLGMIFPAGAAGHKTIAEIDQTAQGDKGKQQGLFESHGMGRTRLLFQDGSGPHMGIGPDHIVPQ